MSEQKIKYDYTREDLLNICSKSFVKETRWNHPDYPELMIQAGELYGILKCECDFTIVTPENATEEDKANEEITDECRICIRISVLPPDGCIIPAQDQAARDKAKTTSVYLLPTQAELDKHPAYKDEETPAAASETTKKENATPEDTKGTGDDKTPTTEELQKQTDWQALVDKGEVAFKKAEAGFSNNMRATERLRYYQEAEINFKKADELLPGNEDIKAALSAITVAMESLTAKPKKK